MSNRWVQIEVIVVSESEKAWCVQTEENGKAIWLAKSQVKMTENYRSKKWVLDIPEWMALNKGMV